MPVWKPFFVHALRFVYPARSFGTPFVSIWTLRHIQHFHASVTNLADPSSSSVLRNELARLTTTSFVIHADYMQLCHCCKAPSWQTLEETIQVSRLLSETFTVPVPLTVGWVLPRLWETFLRFPAVGRSFKVPLPCPRIFDLFSSWWKRKEDRQIEEHCLTTSAYRLGKFDELCLALHRKAV